MLEPDTINIKIPFVAAVIVVFNDYDSLVVLIESLVDQVNAIVIVDNSDNSDDGYEMPDAVLDMPDIVYQRSAGNKGLAAGINDGVRLSKKLNAEWIVLLDQDSILAADMIRCMLDKYTQNPNIDNIRLLCPDVFLSDKRSHYYPLSFGLFRFKKVTTASDEVDFCITSGSMIKSCLFDDVGYMEESFFIDYIDYDYCLRLRSFGYKILYVSDAKLTHRLGVRKTNKMGIQYTFHSPERIFFQTCNRLTVVRRYGFRFPSFAFMQLSLFVLKFFKILAVEDQKIIRLKFYILL